MSLPTSFTIFSPTFSLFERLTPIEYLASCEKSLAMLPKWKDAALAIALISAATLIVSAAIAVIAEDESKAEDTQGRVYNIAMTCGMFSIVALILSLAAYPSMKYGIEPMLLKRIEWLQAGLANC